MEEEAGRPEARGIAQERAGATGDHLALSLFNSPQPLPN